ncbi:MAG: hypothetical protein RMJ44_04355 [Cytophagales bacterium]|nr:hypothetical protein [Bernardetiaceae bacterium]MDW8210297.1 hypothetical protein [Cytophagales bacterium]
MSPQEEMHYLLNQSTAVELSNDEQAQLLGKLTRLVQYLLDHHRPYLFAAVYRMDISEKMLKKALCSGSGETIALNIAALMLERQKQKMKWRQSYKKEPFSEG